MSKQHDLTLLDNELAEIVHHVQEEYGYNELKKAVKEMRAMQERYFQLKKRGVPNEMKQPILVESKKLEKIVDDLISDKLF